MSVIENLGYTSLALVVVIAIFVIIVTLIEKKLGKLIIKTRNKRDLFYQKEFKAIDKTNSEKTIEGMDSIARNFFAEAFQVNKNDYTDLKQVFKKTKNKKAEEFCDSMIKVLYSKEKNNAEIGRALNLLNEIILSTHIPSKDEQEELKKISQESSFKKFLRKIHILGVDEKKDQNKKENTEKQ